MSNLPMMKAATAPDGWVPPPSWVPTVKLDGERIWWDGGRSIGRDVRTIPWAHPNATGVSTGFWSYGMQQVVAPVVAPTVGDLPPYPLDGELHHPDGWGARFRPGALVTWFDAPPAWKLFAARIIKVNGACWSASAAPWAWDGVVVMGGWRARFDRIPSNRVECRVGVSGVDEGTVWRDPNGSYTFDRSKGVVKVKFVSDAEGIVIDTNPGQGRLAGVIGSLVISAVVDGKSVTFACSGMSDHERTLNWIGKRVRFRYRKIGEGGRPVEPRLDGERASE